MSEWLAQIARDGPSFGIAASDAEQLIRDIGKSIGLVSTIKIVPCDYATKAEAWYAPKGIDGVPQDQYIIYNPDWLREVVGNDRTQAIAILGHELGHFVNGHFFGPPSLLPRSQQELQSDRFSGCAVARLGGSWAALENVIARVRRDKDEIYPERLQSLNAAREGYDGCVSTTTDETDVIVADARSGLFCKKTLKTQPFVTFFDYATVNLAQCAPSGDSGSRSFLVHYPQQYIYSNDQDTRAGYDHCHVSDLSQKGPLIRRAIELFFSENLSTIPCQTSLSVTRIINASYVGNDGQSKSMTFAQFYGRGSDNSLDIEQIPTTSVVHSDQLDSLHLQPNGKFELEDIMAQIRLFRFVDIPKK